MWGRGACVGALWSAGGEGWGEHGTRWGQSGTQRGLLSQEGSILGLRGGGPWFRKGRSCWALEAESRCVCPNGARRRPVAPETLAWFWRPSVPAP